MRVLATSLLLLLAACERQGKPAASSASQSTARSDAAFVEWAQANAIPLRPVDEPYQDSSFAFLGPLVSDARIFALGEPIHGGHEPLAFRNQLIRYAVTHLGFTAVALESGFTEGGIVDRYIQGGAGNIDTVHRTGITWGFQTLAENKELIAWLREHNSQAKRKVHFFGIDLTGGDDVGTWPGAARAVVAALDYLKQVSPATASDLGKRLIPLMDRFLPDRYSALTQPEREQIRAGLDQLLQALQRDSARSTRATSRLGYARAVRDAWVAVRLNNVMAASGPDAFRTGAILRDSAMAENTQWVLDQQGDSGRVFLFAHNAHVINAPFGHPALGAPWKMEGQYLRAWFGPRLVVLGSLMGAIVGSVNTNTGWIEGTTETPADSNSFAAALAKVDRSPYVLDLRTSDKNPAVAATLNRSWPLKLLFPIQVVPRQTFDATVFFRRVTASPGH